MTHKITIYRIERALNTTVLNWTKVKIRNKTDVNLAKQKILELRKRQPWFKFRLIKTSTYFYEKEIEI